MNSPLHSPPPPRLSIVNSSSRGFSGIEGGLSLFQSSKILSAEGSRVVSHEGNHSAGNSSSRLNISREYTLSRSIPKHRAHTPSFVTPKSRGTTPSFIARNALTPTGQPIPNHSLDPIPPPQHDLHHSSHSISYELQRLGLLDPSIDPMHQPIDSMDNTNPPQSQAKDDESINSSQDENDMDNEAISAERYKEMVNNIRRRRSSLLGRPGHRDSSDSLFTHLLHYEENKILEDKQVDSALGAHTRRASVVRRRDSIESIYNHFYIGKTNNLPTGTRFDDIETYLKKEFTDDAFRLPEEKPVESNRDTIVKKQNALNAQERDIKRLTKVDRYREKLTINNQYGKQSRRLQFKQNEIEAKMEVDLVKYAVSHRLKARKYHGLSVHEDDEQSSHVEQHEDQSHSYSSVKSYFDHPKLDSIEEKLEDLRQEEIEKWCKKHGKTAAMKLFNKDKRMLRRWFKEIDVDHSGEVTADELMDALLSSGIFKTREQVILTLANIDNDRNNGVDFEEFLQALQSNKLADRKKLEKLREMSSNEFGFSMETLLTEERRIKFLQSIYYHAIERHDNFLAGVVKVEKSKHDEKEHNKAVQELKAIEEKHKHSLQLHDQYIEALEAVVLDKQAGFYSKFRLAPDIPREYDTVNFSVERFRFPTMVINSSGKQPPLSSSLIDELDKLVEKGTDDKVKELVDKTAQSIIDDQSKPNSYRAYSPVKTSHSRSSALISRHSLQTSAGNSFRPSEMGDLPNIDSLIDHEKNKLKTRTSIFS